MTKPTIAEIKELAARINTARDFYGNRPLKLEGIQTEACGNCSVTAGHTPIVVPTYFFYRKPHIKIEPHKPVVQIGFVRNIK